MGDAYEVNIKKKWGGRGGREGVVGGAGAASERSKIIRRGFDSFERYP